MGEWPSDEDPEPPAEIRGFGNCLLWILATRAPELVDSLYQSGRAKATQDFRMLDGRDLPTRAVVAWLLLAAELGVHPARLPRGDRELDRQHNSLRARMSLALDSDPHRFKDAWLNNLAAMCGLTEPELRLLKRRRDGTGYPVDAAALRKAVADTRRVGLPPGRVERAVPAGQLVVGAIPQEPPGFVARETLDLLADAAGHGQVMVVCAVTGLRGVGKTQLAAAYARRRVREGWTLVGWVNAETTDSMLVGLARIAGRLGVADPLGDSRESALRLREHLQTRATDALLVLDNVVSPDVLREFMPATGCTQVMVTSTNQAFAEFSVAVEVPVYTRPESLRFLRERTKLEDSDGADAVADAVADHPLALAQAAAMIRRQRLTYPGYLGRLRQVPVRELLGAIPGGDYPYPVAAALLLSVQAAEAGDATGIAGRLLRVVAVMSPDGVRRDLLAGLAAAGTNGHGATGVEEAAERCVVGSLLTWCRRRGKRWLCTAFSAEFCESETKRKGSGHVQSPRLWTFCSRGSSPKARPGSGARKVLTSSPRPRHCGTRPQAGTPPSRI
jgi:hypothetical protein